MSPLTDSFAYLDGSTIETHYQSLHPACEAVLSIMSHRLQRELETGVPAVQVKGRIKRLPSLLEKLHRKLDSEDQGNPLPAFRRIPDLLAIRAVCPFQEDVEAAVAAAGKLFQVLEVDQKGEDRAFSEFGYASTHLSLAIPPDLLASHPCLEGFHVELQVRTILQDAWAEVEHELIYKVGAHPLNLAIRRKLAALNAMLVLSDTIFQEIRDYQKSNIADLTRARQNFLDHTANQFVPDESVVDDCPALVDEEPLPPASSSKFEIEKLLKKALNAQIAGELEDAIRLYTRLLAHPLDAFTASVVLNHRGMAAESLERHEDALRDFSQARERDPNNARAGINLAMACRQVGRLPEAETTLRQVLEKKPSSAHAHYGLARVLADMGRKDDALRSCLRALKLDEGFTLASRLREELEAPDTAA
jgi:putative GTP pyrophosphokinase